MTKGSSKRLFYAGTSALLSLLGAAVGIVGCSQHEWSRQGLPQDAITHAWALLAYVSLLSLGLSLATGSIFLVAAAFPQKRQ